MVKQDTEFHSRNEDVTSRYWPLLILRLLIFNLDRNVNVKLNFDYNLNCNLGPVVRRPFSVNGG